MTATINGVMVTGTPDEIATLIKKLGKGNSNPFHGGTTTLTPNFTTLCSGSGTTVGA